MSTTDADTITTSEVAERIGKSVRQTNRLIQAGELKPIKKLPGRTGTHLFDASEYPPVPVGASSISQEDRA